MTTTRPIALLLLVSLVLLIFSSTYAQNPVQEATPESFPACQIYRLTVPEGRVRACAGMGCAVSGGVNNQEALCIRGISENPEWYLIDLNPSQPNQSLDYISASIIEPGAPGQDTSLFNYCDAYEVNTEALVVRSCANQSCTALGQYTSGELLCVTGYAGEYNYWYELINPADGTRGWARSTDVSYRYDEDLGCTDDDSWVVVPSSIELRSCAQITCNVSGTLTTNTGVCMVGEQFSDAEWVSVDFSDERAGWVSGLLLRKLSEAELDQRRPVVNAPEGQTINFVASATPEISATEVPPETATQTPVSVAQAQVFATSTPGLGAPAPAVVCQEGVDNANCITATPSFASAFASPTPMPTLPPAGPIFASDITLANLFVDGVEVRSPRGSSNFFFSVPENWAISGNNVLYLNLNYFEDVSRVRADLQELGIASIVDVRLDGRLISSITLDQSNVGEQTLAIPLPNDILNDPQRRFHEISLQLDARDYCELEALTRLSADPARSFFHFEYQEFQPVLDLALYPRPFYNNIPGQTTELVWIVLPDEPNQAEIQAATHVAAGLGMLTNNRLQIELASAGSIDPQVRSNYNMIVIGSYESNSLISNLYDNGRMPTQRNNNELVLRDENIPVEDGLLQILRNPENDQRVILVVTGETEEALLKASQALAGQPSVLGLAGPVIVVDDLNPEAVPLAPVALERYLFEDLGYTSDIIVSGLGAAAQTIAVDFPVAAQGMLREDAFVEVIYNSSLAIQTSNATVTIFINNVPIGSGYLRQEQPEGELATYRKLRAQIPASAVIPGQTNTMTIVADMIGDWDCEIPLDQAIWFTVSNQSSINLPRQASTDEQEVPLVQRFPRAFTDQPDLSNVYFSVPSAPAQSDVIQLLRIASAMGAVSPGTSRVTPRVSLGKIPTASELNAGHAIIIGRPTTNPFLAELNALLPQPFAPDTDTLQQVLENVTYRLLPGFDIGVLQMLQAPWDTTKRVLVVTGTSETGQFYAANALLDSTFRFDLFGDVVFASAENSRAIETRWYNDRSEVLAEIPALLGSTPLPSLTPLPELGPTEVAALPAVSVTPGPTATLPPTSIPIDTSAQGLFASLTEAPTQLPTSVPTLAPLALADLSPVTVTRPDWVDTLIVITVVASNLALFYGLYRLLLLRRRRN